MATSYKITFLKFQLFVPALFVLLTLASSLFLTPVTAHGEREDSPRHAMANVWAKAYTGPVRGGGPPINDASSVTPTPDGGVIIAGTTNSFGIGGTMDCSVECGMEVLSDVWVLKLDSAGNVVWQKTYGGDKSDSGVDIQPTADGGYILLAVTTSFPSYTGVPNTWILKLNHVGDVQWQRVYGRDPARWPMSILQTRDAGYLVTGFAGYTGLGSVTSAWLLKVDSSGNKIWEKGYGQPSSVRTFTAAQASDGGFIVAGWERTQFLPFTYRSLIFKVDKSGNTLWQESIPGAAVTTMHSTLHGCCILAGWTFNGAGGKDAWIAKIDSRGNVLWQNAYGGKNEDAATSIRPTRDGGYVVAGYTFSFGPGIVMPNLDFIYPWVFKLDSVGKIVWQRTFSPSTWDNFAAQTSDGGFALVGAGISVRKLDSQGACCSNMTETANALTTRTHLTIRPLDLPSVQINSPVSVTSGVSLASNATIITTCMGRLRENQGDFDSQEND